jgi:hypothetical protein
MEVVMTKEDLNHHKGEFNIICDVAGQYKTLLALLEKMPKTATPLAIGDLIDRGPNNQDVMDFFMKDGNLAIKGNHDHMMEMACKGTCYYRDGVWEYNGGDKTLENFGINALFIPENYDKIPERYVKFIEGLPLYMFLDEYNTDGLQGFVSHAAKNPTLTLEQCAEVGERLNNRTEEGLLWNRGEPRRKGMPFYYQICGHNSHWGLKTFKDKEGEYAKCIDTTRSNVLTAMHWPTGEIFQQEYID